MSQSGQGSNHFLDGGDGVTNFLLTEAQLYAEAIAAYKSGDLYIGLPMPPVTSENYLALRLRGRRDLSDFWDLLDSLRDRK